MVRKSVERYVDTSGRVSVYSGGKAKLRTFREEVDLLGVEAVCEVSNQIEFVSGGVLWFFYVLWFGGVLWFVSVLRAGCVLLVISVDCVALVRRFSNSF